MRGKYYKYGGRKNAPQTKKNSSISFNEYGADRHVITGPPCMPNTRENLKRQERLLKQSYVIDGPRESLIEQQHRVSSHIIRQAELNGQVPY